MAQIGSDSNPMVFRKAIVSKPSRFRKGMNNYDRIFNKKHETEIDLCRAKSKTFSMAQE